DLHPGGHDPLGQGPDTIPARKEGLVLKVDIVEAITVPELLQAQRHALGLEPYPLAPVHEGIRAEGAAKCTSLGGDVIQLPFALELEIALHGYQVVIVGAKLLDWGQRPCGILLNRAVLEANGAAGTIAQRAPFAQALHDFGESLLTLPL